jgi:hypothetical protein
VQLLALHQVDLVVLEHRQGGCHGGAPYKRLFVLSIEQRQSCRTPANRCRDLSLFNRSSQRLGTTLTAMIHRSHCFGTTARRTPAVAHGPIEWEALPSLADALRRGEFTRGPAWVHTQAMELPPDTSHTTQLDEPIHGLQVREIEGPTLFGHLFD